MARLMGVGGAPPSCGDTSAFPGTWDCQCRHPDGGDITPHAPASKHTLMEVKAACGPRRILGDCCVCSKPPGLSRARVLPEHLEAWELQGTAGFFCFFSPFPVRLVPWGPAWCIPAGLFAPCLAARSHHTPQSSQRRSLSHLHLHLSAKSTVGVDVSLTG